MFIRYNETAKYYEYDTSVAQNGTGPWLILPIDYTQIYNPPVIPPPTPIPPNIAFTDVRNDFSSDQEIKKAIPAVVLTDTGQPANAKKFRVINASGILFLQGLSDDESIAYSTATLDRFGNFSTSDSFFEKTRTVAMGHWINNPHDAGDYITYLTGTWTVGAGAIVRNRYTLIGKTMIWSLYLSWFSGSNTLTGSPTTLYIKLPGGYSCPGNIFLTGGYATSAGARIDIDYSPNGAQHLGLNRRDGAAFADVVGLIFTLSFEIS